MTDIETAFELEFVPEDLHSFILEKLTYRDFASLEKCSLFSKSMVQNLPKSVKLWLDFFTLNLEVTKEEEKLCLSEENSQITIEKIPFFVRIFTEELWIHRERTIQERDIQDLYETSIAADWIYIYDPGSIDIARLIHHVEPIRLRLNCGGVEIATPILSLDEIKKMDDLEIELLFDTPDDLVLNLNASRLRIDGYFFLSEDGVIKFLQQWKEGRRRIESISFDIDLRFLDINWSTLFEKDAYSTDAEGGHVFCRSEDHSDCIRVKEYSSNNVLKITAAKCAKKCRKRKAENSAL